MTNAEHSRLDFADALRGYAILAVISVHCWMFLNLKNVSIWIQTIFINGNYGVQLFFIVSAFTLFYSLTYAHSAHEGWLAFFIRRAFRILPMFYIAIVLYSILLTINIIPILGTNPSDATPANILSHIFLFFAIDPIHINTLVPGGWSIATELTFYLILPLIFIIVKKPIHIIILLLFSAVSNLLLGLALQGSDFGKANTAYIFWWLPNQFTVFCLGILLFFILKETMFESDIIKNTSKLNRQGISAVCILLSAILIYYYLYVMPLHSVILLYALSVAFLLFAIGIAIYPFKLLVNDKIIYIGKISYSCYLLHFIVVSVVGSLIMNLMSDVNVYVLFVMYGIVINITIIISHFTYTYIEQPGINMGKRLIKKINGE